ncbi:hypothetical protein EJB05_23002, partial [Eragrostis curvula]
MPFAHAVLAAGIPPRDVIGLVPCAQGATPLANWTRGTELYDRMVTRTKAALADCGDLAGMLWFQGETDAMKREDAELYQSRMEALVRDVRRDLNKPDLPRHRGQSKQFLTSNSVLIVTAQYGGKYLDRVREAQKAVSRSLPNVKYVDAKGLQIASDYTHLTTQAQVQLGRHASKVLPGRTIVFVSN